MLKLATVASVASLKNTDNIVLGVVGTDNNIYLTPIPVTYMIAVAFMRFGKDNLLYANPFIKSIGCYTYWESNAKQIAIDASDPFDPNATNEYYKPIQHTPKIDSMLPFKLYFSHWHPAFLESHAWYGIPMIKGL